MKPIALAAVALATLSVPAAAADLATKYPVKALVAPVFSWTGFYIGGNIGLGANSVSSSGLLAEDEVVLGYNDGSSKSSGLFGGGQIGYNYQFANNVVFGIETDLQGSNISSSVSANVYDSVGALTDTLSVGSTVNYFGTIRARLGYAVDRFLPYITGGAAYGRTSFSGTYINDSGTVASGSNAATTWGWTVGAGAEFAVTNNWTFKAEYLYVDLGSINYAFGVANTDIVGAGTVDSKFHTAKAGVNYKF